MDYDNLNLFLYLIPIELKLCLIVGMSNRSLTLVNYSWKNDLGSLYYTLSWVVTTTPLCAPPGPTHTPFIAVSPRPRSILLIILVYRETF